MAQNAPTLSSDDLRSRRSGPVISVVNSLPGCFRFTTNLLCCGQREEVGLGMTATIDYGNLMHRAMRGLIQEVLENVRDNGLPGLLRLVELEPVAHVPEQVTDAVAGVVGKRPGGTDPDEVPDPGCGETVHELEILLARRGRQQPPNRQRQTSGQGHAGHPVKDRHDHVDQGTVDLEMRRKWSIVGAVRRSRVGHSHLQNGCR